MAISAITHFQFSRRHALGKQASDHHSRNSTFEQLRQHRAVDRAELPVKRAADNGEHQSKQDVGAHHFRRRHLGIVEQQNGSQRAGARGRKAGFDSDGKRQPRKPAGILVREALILHARNEGDARGSGQQKAEQDHHDRAACVAAEQPQNVRADQQAGNRAQHQEPQIAPVDVPAGEIKRTRRSAAAPRRTRTRFPRPRRRGNPTISTSAGTVKLPPPMPVKPTASAMKKPIRIVH